MTNHQRQLSEVAQIPSRSSHILRSVISPEWSLFENGKDLTGSRSGAREPGTMRRRARTAREKLPIAWASTRRRAREQRQAIYRTWRIRNWSEGNQCNTVKQEAETHTLVVRRNLQASTLSTLEIMMAPAEAKPQ